ncbi:MAG: hypothetical protein A3J74_09500 [Elusimicrobia bacterium RIFCSPHIGHO2_02_FULL_57_9]|nr:MAG: hypothetical protein A3J74_09500 [Elusimicrobia bacterium RIFCSPHIGHO2_02_FULL_57_9]
MKKIKIAGLVLALASVSQAGDIVFKIKDKGGACYKAALPQIKALASDSDQLIVTRKPTKGRFFKQASELCEGANDDAPVICHRAAFPIIKATAGYYAEAASEQAVHLCRGARSDTPLAAVECFQSGVEAMAAFKKKEQAADHSEGKGLVPETVTVCSAGNLTAKDDIVTATR